MAYVFFFLSLKAYTQHQTIIHGKKYKYDATLRTDGLYNTWDTSLMPCGDKISHHYRIYSPLYIINEGNAIYMNGGGDRGTLLSSLSYFQNLKSYQNIIGTISIENKQIKATLPIELYVWGMRLKTFTAHFEGEIKNKDTIFNWHIVQPYPDAPKKFNEGFRNLIKPKLLYFIQSEELLGLDSLYQVKLREKVNKR